MNEELRKALDLVKANSAVQEVVTEISGIIPISAALKMVEEHEDGKKFLNTYADKRVTTGVNTALENFKKKEMVTFVADALKKQEDELTKKLKPEMTEFEKKQLETDKKVSELERKNKIADTKLSLTNLFTTNKIKSEFIDLFVSEDTDTAVSNATKFVASFNQAVKDVADLEVKEVFKKAGYDPQGSHVVTKTVVTKELLKAAEDKARQIGTVDARAEYALLKQDFENQTQK